MKQQKEFYAIAKNGTNEFLCKYQNNERSLTFSASFSKDILLVSIFKKSDDETTESIKNIAKAVGGRLVKVKAEYEITEEDGSELQEPDEGNEEYGSHSPEDFDRFLKKMLGL